MNILQILPELNLGGVETGTLDLAQHLVKLGHKAVVVSNGGELVAELESLGARHYQLPVAKKSLFSVLRLVPALAEIIRKEHIDIVHARSRVPAWIAYFACRLTQTVFITTCHGYYRKHIFSQVMGWAKRVIVISNVIGRHMADDFGLPHERMRLIPRSVDPERFKYTDPSQKRKEEFHVGIVGRITPLKGHLDFMKAMAKVLRVVPALKIWVVGDAPASHEAYKEQVEVLVRRLGLSHCTQFLGQVRDIPAVMAQLDVLVLATISHEAFGRVIIEAQASGVPVVATRVGGVVDIIEEGKNGLLVSASDPQGMAGAVIRLFKEPQLAKTLAEYARAKVEKKYTIELMVKNTLEVYREALRDFKLLVIKLSSLGDVILSTAALRAIREKFSSHYKISFLVGEEAKEILFRCPYIDELLVCDLGHKDKGIKGLFNLGYILRKKNFDLVIDLQNNRKSHILSFLSRSLKRYGYDKKFGFLLNYRLKDSPKPLEPVRHQFRILKMLGIDLTKPDLELWPASEDQVYVDEFLDSAWVGGRQKIIGINISASQRWQSKNWPLKHLVKLCQELGKGEIRVVFTGTQKDISSVHKLEEMLKDTKIINACGKTTVNQLACLVKRCAVYVSPDSASLHIAAAVNTPFVALFGPTDAQRHLPPAKKYVLLKKDLDCSPCYKPKCKKRECMDLITPEEVRQAIDRLLNP